MSPRPDLYRLLHKGLRAAMFDTVLHIGQVDARDAPALDRALDQAQQLLALLASHIRCWRRRAAAPRALHRSLLAGMEPRTLQEAERWMDRALNPQERAAGAP
jgi:hypothetical protein